VYIYEGFKLRKNNLISSSLDIVVKSGVTGNYFNVVSVDPDIKADVLLYISKFVLSARLL
jgi:hypothetical protein